MSDDTVYWVWLNELRDLSLKEKRNLLLGFGNPRDIYQADTDSICEVLSDSSSAFRTLWTGRNLGSAESILSNNEKHAIRCICSQDDNYRHIFDADQKAPLVLYYRGTFCDPATNVVGVIGSRSCSSYAELVAKAAVSDLVEKGNVIASGLSFGIDAIAHETTLQAKGVTYAFVPCGLHKAQPASHAALMDRIADTGLLITPYAYGKEALPYRFIGRNDLLASWCNTLLVIEARTKSGSIRTARSALAKGKRVLAVPNSLLEPKGAGTNLLLSEGATAYLNDRLVMTFDSSTVQGETLVLQSLHNKALTTSELGTLELGDETSILDCLTEMELEGKVRYCSDGKWHAVMGM